MNVGLPLTALGFGLRHGVDWDHIAAIADLSGTAETRKRGFVLSMLYAVGHGVVVFALGVLAIALGTAIPSGVDVWMGRVVGATLVALGIWILVELVRKGRAFRLRSRWMLVISGTFAGLRRVKDKAQRKIVVDHAHDHEHPDHQLATTVVEPDPDHDHAHASTHVHHKAPVPMTAGASTGQRSSRWASSHRNHHHSHSHKHELLLPDQANARYGNGTAAGIGMLHGIGVESPTQIAIFVASTAAVGTGFGVLLLSAWVLGLILANACLALAAGAGLLHAEKSFPIYAALAVFVGVMSIGLGSLYLLGLDLLPALS